jgi:hypothetical protein
MAVDQLPDKSIRLAQRVAEAACQQLRDTRFPRRVAAAADDPAGRSL